MLLSISENKPKLGISGCLLGQNIRFNGSHCRSDYVANVLDKFFLWHSVCPEVGMGMPVPREPVYLEGDSLDKPSLKGKRSGKDYAPDMDAYLERILPELEAADLDGFILKKRSPSCGMERIAVQATDGRLLGFRSGLFATALMKAYPLMPVEDEGRLFDLDLRESFISRVYAYHRWRKMLKNNPGAVDLVKFHTDYKLILMARDPRATRNLGRIVAEAGLTDLKIALDLYAPLFMETMKKKALPGRQANVLYRLMGILGNTLSEPDREEMTRYIEAYRTTQVPLSAPMILLNHHFKCFPQTWSAVPKYLTPYPWGFETGFALSV